MSVLLDRQAAAEYLGVSRPTIDKMLQDGRLEATSKVKGTKPLFSLEYLQGVKPTLRIHETGGRVRKQREKLAATTV